MIGPIEFFVGFAVRGLWNMDADEVTSNSVLLFIVNYNSWADLDAMLGSMVGLKVKPDIVIYDNASVSDNFLELRGRHPGVPFSVCYGKGNFGYAGALREFLYSHPLAYETVVLSNADILFTDSEVFLSFSQIASDSTVGLIGPVVTDAKTGRHLNPHSVKDVGFVFILKKLLTFSCFKVAKFINDRHRYGRDVSLVGNGEVFSVHGCFFAISRRLIISEGLSFIPWMYGEEEIFAMKAKCAGLRVVYDKSTQIIHNSHGVTGVKYEKWKHLRKKEAFINTVGMKIFGCIRSIFQ